MVSKSIAAHRWIGWLAEAASATTTTLRRSVGAQLSRVSSLADGRGRASLGASQLLERARAKYDDAAAALSNGFEAAKAASGKLCK